MKCRQNMLESEPSLARRLQMSRETIRKALTELEREGWISRWHGKGNFGHPTVSRLPMRFDLNSNFKLLLEQAGFSVTAFRGAWEDASVPPSLARRIPSGKSTGFITFIQDMYADDQLAIISTVYIDKEFLRAYPEQGQYTDNIDAFFSTHCTMKSEYVIAWPKAHIDEAIAKRFNLDADLPLLVWEEAYFTIYDECMGVIEVYFNPLVMDLSMLLHF